MFMRRMKIVACFLMLLGFVHLCAAFVFFKNTTQATGLYMYSMTGFSVLFVSFLQFMLLKQCTTNETMFGILKYTVLYFVVSGLGAVATMCNNPFAYAILFVALYECYLLYMKYRSFKSVE